MLNLRSVPRRAQRGLSLVELMVGVAVGLFVVAGASFVVATQLGDNRRLLLETQIQQDLRATMDIITRELRRAGAIPTLLNVVWYPGTPGVLRNPRSQITVGAGQDRIEFEYRRESGVEGPLAFRLDNGRSQTQVGPGN